MRVCPHLTSVTSVTSVRTWMGRWRVCVCVEFVTRKGYWPRPYADCGTGSGCMAVSSVAHATAASRRPALRDCTAVSALNARTSCTGRPPT